jgi:hypothetical protein
VVSEPVDLIAVTEPLLEDAECWQRAEWHLLTTAFEARLAELGVPVTADGGRALIAAALFLAEHTDEWGADARDILAEAVALGRSMVEREQHNRRPSQA